MRGVKQQSRSPAGLFDRLKDFPEGALCEHGVHLKRDAYAAFLDLRQLIEREVLPALTRRAGRPD